VGPIALKGSRHRDSIGVGKDVVDGAVGLRLAGSRRRDEVLGFLGECGKDLGLPDQVQLDNARELSGWGPAARTLSRVIRLGRHFGVGPVFIPAGEPQFNGSVEDFNGWSQPRLFDRRYKRPGDRRRELARLQEAVNTQHVHPRLGGQTPAQHRRGLRLRKWPASVVVPTDRPKRAAGRVTFIRRVSPAGTVSVLSQSYRVGKRHRGLYLRLVVDTGRGWLTADLNGRVLKRWPYKLRNDGPTPDPAAAGGSRNHSAQRCGGGCRTLHSQRCVVGSQHTMWSGISARRGGPCCSRTRNWRRIVSVATRCSRPGRRSRRVARRRPTRRQRVCRSRAFER
jgi:putative transposase